MDSNFQRTVHNIGGNGYRVRAQNYQRDWDFIHYLSRHNNAKMAETVKYMLNALGISIYILGILANLSNIVSVTLGVVGLAYAIIRAFKAYEDYLIRKIERMERQRDYKNNVKRTTDDED